ncbi:MAG TPA: hypothetical protein VE263_21455 [Candidatus Angelobacter sp.]|nr:hypothetical protein [Candidatus Angelobacter sp.]
MKKLAALTLSLFLTTGMAFADTPKDADPQPAKPAAPAKAKAAKKAEKSDSAIAAEIEELRQALQSQQEQLQLLKEELAKRDRQIDEAREAAAAANARASEASSKAVEAANSSAEVKTTAATLNSTVSDLKASNEVLKTTVAKEQADAQKAEETGPATIKYKGINITPGGWIEAATVSRTRATGADINTPFTGIPYPGQAIGKVSENNFTARQSRLTLLGEAKVGTAKVSAYYEGDFLGTGVTSNNRQSNSYVFRQRQLWASAKFDSGLYISAGQMWSLVTESKKGIENRQEAFPLMVDPQYIVGWAWQRAYQFRVAKNWDKFAVGFSIEGPQTTIGGRGFPANFFINSPGAGGGLYNFVDTSGYSLNRAPDFLFKIAADPGWGHYEVVGIVSSFRNRIYPCSDLPLPTFPTATCASATSVAGVFNDSRMGGGVGATARFPLFAKKVDLALHVQGGDGIARFSSAQLADVTARPDGTLAPIHSYAWLGTIEAHPNPKLDLFSYFGGEYAARTSFNFTNAAGHPVPVGYGNALFNNSGCSTETFPVPSGTGIGQPSAPTAPGGVAGCAGDIHQIVEGTLGFWHKIYNGPKGRVQWGLTYSYITKYGWSGNNFNSATGVAGPSLRPHAVDNMVWTSFRYYLP